MVFKQFQNRTKYIGWPIFVWKVAVN